MRKEMEIEAAQLKKQQKFVYQYIEDQGWFDHERRLKIAQAMETLGRRIAEDDLQKLPFRLVVFAPADSYISDFFSGEGTMIYLSPEIESRSQEEVDCLVATRFAEVIVKCYRFREDNDNGFTTHIQETAVEGYLRKWGY
jgi:hypothetical protein